MFQSKRREKSARQRLISRSAGIFLPTGNFRPSARPAGLENFRPEATATWRSTSRHRSNPPAPPDELVLKGPDLSGGICFAISSVAATEQHDGRPWPEAERDPEPELARSSALPSHLCRKRHRRQKDDKNESRPHVHLTVSDCRRKHSTEPALKCRTSEKCEEACLAPQAVKGDRGRWRRQSDRRHQPITPYPERDNARRERRSTDAAAWPGGRPRRHPTPSRPAARGWSRTRRGRVRAAPHRPDPRPTSPIP